ncbi:unnamed protein product [Allacma fusca]|uniref:Choline transporter-like protein n=1 Tax=Allacma fusca TaxID=39272 RepID=A0A8J2LG37_9HEXA|nr:unnamed protein product [Allacma fusca]
MAKCITAALTGLIALVIFRSDDSLYFYAIPVLLTVVFSYFVAHCVISVFEMAVDTLFLCFCEDHNMNDGTDGKEFYAPESLLKFMTEDAVDAVGPGRRPGYSSKDKNHKAPIELNAIPEESIPMNTAKSS